MAAFRRNAYSTIVFRLSDQSAVTGLKKAIDDDPRLQIDAKPEIQFYAEQSEALATFIRILGLKSLNHLFDRRHCRRHDHHVRCGRPTRW